MAAASPVSGNSSVGTPPQRPISEASATITASATVAATATATVTATVTATATATAATAAAATTTTTPKQNLRGLNKPKCSKCGNVARSRCPYQSCKSCCAKAQNPCPIHVLKPNATFPDKSPSSSSPLFDQHATDASPTGASPKVSSFRQLSSNFAPSNGAHASIRARKPLSRKEASAINAWRFSKLKEYKESYIEAENEAFERYMQNVSLLEEAFFLNSSLEGLTPEGLPVLGASSLDKEDGNRAILGLRARLKSNPERADKYKKRIRDLINQGLEKLQKPKPNGDLGCGVADNQDMQDPKRLKIEDKSRLEKISAINDLLDKLNKARSVEDLKDIKDTKLKLFNQNEASDSSNSVKSGLHKTNKETSSDPPTPGDVSTTKQEPDAVKFSPLPRLFTVVEVNQETLLDLDVKFTSLDEHAEL